MNLSTLIEQKLSGEVTGVLHKAAQVAERKDFQAYLVGGMVRDLMLGNASLDIDIAVEGDGIAVAHELAALIGGKLTMHERFNTAKIRYHELEVDIATCREETYPKPGALPVVRPSGLEKDLCRRDFAINAMAVSLNRGNYGELIDIFGGADDIGRKLVRVLHTKSFIDDATRIWRAIRYEQRLGFKIEKKTLELLHRDINYLDTISGDRIRRELELVLDEKQPETMLQRADELGVLGKLNKSLHGDAWLAKMFKKGRTGTHDDSTKRALYIGLMVWRSKPEDVEKLVAGLKLSRRLAATARDVIGVKTASEELTGQVKPSHIYAKLSGFSQTAITVNLVATENDEVKKNLGKYLDSLRDIRPGLLGREVVGMGIEPGPQVKQIMDLLRDARLDGTIEGKEQERAFVRQWQKSHST